MQPFTLKAPCRLEDGKRVWNTTEGKWITTKPRLVENPPQQLTEEQTAYIEKNIRMLGEYIVGVKELREGSEARQKAGPVEFIYAAFQQLQHSGFALIEDTPPVKHLMGYLWDLVHRCETREIEWEVFEDQVERWQLVMLDKITRAKTNA